MNSRWSTTAAVWALALLLLSIGGVFGYVLGRGRAPALDDAPRPEPLSERVDGVEAEPSTATDEARAANSQRVRAALHDIEAQDAEVRARSLRTVLDAGYTHAEIVRLVVRPKVPNWQGKALADMLSSDPGATLPPLLHRLTHSAPEQRALICDALGASRQDTHAASAVLVVRALLDSFDGVRERALSALEMVDSAAAAAVTAHYDRGQELADGSVAGLYTSLLIENGCPYASGPSRRAFLDALRADGARFGNTTVIRVGAFLAPLPGGKPWLESAMRQLLEYDDLDEEGTILLAGLGPDLVSLLRRRLMEPDAPASVATLLGYLGVYARLSVPDLLQVVAERRPIWRAALVAAVRLSSGDARGTVTEADTGALLPLIHDDEMGAHVAWALGATGAASPEALEALCVRLAHRATMGHGAVQAEGALKRLLAQGHGFDQVTALLQSDHEGVLRAAIRIISLCHERDREAVLALLEDVGTSAPSRSVRKTVERAMKLLSAGEAVREAERLMQSSGLAQALEEQ